MKWFKLLSNKCPKCGKELDFESDFEYLLCDISCGFQISHKRFKEICADQSKYNSLNQNNQQYLNNLKTVEKQEDEDLQELADML